MTHFCYLRPHGEGYSLISKDSNRRRNEEEGVATKGRTMDVELMEGSSVT